MSLKALSCLSDHFGLFYVLYPAEGLAIFPCGIHADLQVTVGVKVGKAGCSRSRQQERVAGAIQLEALDTRTGQYCG